MVTAGDDRHATCSREASLLVSARASARRKCFQRLPALRLNAASLCSGSPEDAGFKVPYDLRGFPISAWWMAGWNSSLRRLSIRLGQGLTQGAA